jgi:hypothetical protein
VSIGLVARKSRRRRTDKLDAGVVILDITTMAARLN